MRLYHLRSLVFQTILKYIAKGVLKMAKTAHAKKLQEARKKAEKSGLMAHKKLIADAFGTPDQSHITKKEKRNK